ncbi:MAG: hypothetical protein ABI210_00150, partial [Abditibacteriaceae bacterium]
MNLETQQKYFSQRLRGVVYLGMICAGGALLSGCHSSQNTASSVTAAQPPIAVQVVDSAIHPMENVVQVQGVLSPGPGGSVAVMPVAGGRLNTV